MGGQVNVVGQMKVQNFAQGINDNTGQINYLGTKDNIIDIKPKPYAINAQPFPWDVDDGSGVLIDQSCLSGCGVRTSPIQLVSNSRVLEPNGEQILYSAYAPYSSYVAQITGDTSGTAVAIALPGGNPKIPWQLLYNGLGIRVKASFKHASGAIAPYLRIYLGNSTSLVSTLLLSDGWTSAVGEEMGLDVIARITKLGVSNAGAYTPTEGRMFDSKGLSKALNSSYVDRAISTNVDLYVVPACFPNNQTINIQRLQVSLVP